MQIKWLAWSCLVAGILSCGGGGGGGGSSSSGSPPSGVAGLWYGNVAGTSGIGATDASGLAYLCAPGQSGSDVIIAQLEASGTTLTGSTFTGAGIDFKAGGAYNACSITSGALVPTTSMSGGWTAPSGSSGSFSFTYDALSTRPVSIASLAGNYLSSWVNTGGSASITLASSGAISGTAASQAVSGTLTELDATHNLFSLSLAIGSVSGTGFAFWSDGGSSNFTANALYLMADNGTSAVAATLIKQVGTVAIKNSTGQSITGVYIVADPANGVWGTNLLTGSETITTGTTQTYPNYPPGNYDAQVQLADGTTQTNTDFKVSVGSTYTATFNNEEGGVIIDNTSGQSVTGVWIVLDPAGSNWGSNLLTGTSTIATGTSQTFPGFLAGSYDAKVELANSTSQTATDFKVGAGGNYTFTVTNPYGTVQLDNQTTVNITAVYIVLDPQGTQPNSWGSNLLTGTLANGSDQTFPNLAPGTYAVGYVDTTNPGTIIYVVVAVTANKTTTVTATGQIG